jgi:uncharacterized protein YjeT (DUF2065 family)
MKTRLSLYYLATYLLLTGIGLMVAPQLVLKLLFAKGVYGDVFVRFTGAFMIGLGVVVSQIIRHRVEVLYPTTIIVRLFFVVSIIWFYYLTADPLFLCVLSVVGFGLILTASCMVFDRSSNKNPNRI